MRTLVWKPVLLLGMGWQADERKAAFLCVFPLSQPSLILTL